MRPVHPWMHHENGGFDVGAFARLQGHRTDGQVRRSAPLQDFDVRLLFEPQDTIAGIRDLDAEGLVGTELDVPVIDLLLVDCDLRCTAAAVCQEERGDNEYHATYGQQDRPGYAVVRLLPAPLSTHRICSSKAAPF